jgi:hypothetical protein
VAVLSRMGTLRSQPSQYISSPGRKPATKYTQVHNVLSRHLPSLMSYVLCL